MPKHLCFQHARLQHQTSIPDGLEVPSLSTSHQRPAAAQLEHLEAPTAATALAMAVLTACGKLRAIVVTDVDAVPTAVTIIVSIAACDLTIVEHSGNG